MLINAGDIVVGDEIGVTVDPAEYAADVVALAEEQAAREEATRRRIAEGRTFEQLIEECGRI